MADPKTIAASLRTLATGRVEWRVQDPVERCYCISFDPGSSINPEREAREWLADYKRRWPNGIHAHYEVAEVRCFTALEREALAAADALDPCGVMASEPVAWLVPMLNDKPRLFTDLGEARAFCSRQNGMVYPQPLIVAPGYPYRNAGVMEVDRG